MSGSRHVAACSPVLLLMLVVWVAWPVRAAEPPKEDRKDGTPAFEGRKLFLKLQCSRCHSATADAKGPILEKVFGSKVMLKDGGTVVADEAYIVESIRKPKAKVVEGWEPIMPAYDKDAVSDKDLKLLVAYLRSIGSGEAKPK